jgi:hypothetical protein
MLCVSDVGRANASQYRELKSRRPNSIALAKLRHEGRHLGVGQRGLMLDRRNFGRRGELSCEVASPAGWIITGAVASNGCPAENLLDSTALPLRRFCFLAPNRLQNFHDVRRLDVSNVHAA